VRKHSQNPGQRRLFSNFFSLTVLQGLNIVLPLLTMPYLVNTLGADRFGLLAFATALITYFSILTNYGFHITATREVSIHRHDAVKLSEIFSTVIWIKLLLLLASGGLLLLGMLLSNAIRAEAVVYFLTFGLLIGQVLFPVWFFQGVEQMKYITYLSLISKVAYTLTIFLLVNQPGDYWRVPLLVTLEGLFLGIAALLLIKYKFGIALSWPVRSQIRYYLKDGWHIFLSNLAVSMYTNTTVVLLGAFTNHVLVSHYSVADKLIGALKQLMGPLSQSLYPFLSQQAATAKQTVLDTLRKLAIYLTGAGLLATAAVWIYAETLLQLVFGAEGLPAVPIFRILLIIPVLNLLDTLFGTLLMLVFKRNKAFSYIMLSAGLLNLLLAVILIPGQGSAGAAYALLLTELYITFRIIAYTQHNGLRVFGKRAGESLNLMDEAL
jgi:PST family polysaccharide transporter